MHATNKALLFSSYQQSVFQSVPLPGTNTEFIFINVEYNLVKVVLSDLLYVEGLKDYIKLHVKNAKRALLTKITMKGMQELLPVNNFIRIHRSYIVSLTAITIIKKDTVLLGDIELPISDGYKENIYSILGKK